MSARDRRPRSEPRLLGGLVTSILLLLGLACGGGAGAPASIGPVPSSTYGLDVRVAVAPPPGSVAVRLVPFVTGLSSPWAMAFLPDGRLLITEKAGRIRLASADGATLSTVAGAPTVIATGQGGLLDVALDPAFASNRRIYLAFSEAGTGSEAGLSGTAVFRAELNVAGTQLENGVVIFRQVPKVSGSGHYGARLVFRADGTLFVALGERQQGSPAQDTTGHLGKVLRIDPQGNPASGNPAFGSGAQPHLWSIGHRNPQAATLHPQTGELWIAEHGPQGGDEVNLVSPGRNYGWPLVSYGCNYGDTVGTTCRIGGGTHAPTYREPQAFWYPTSTAPGGMAFYTGTRFPEWQGNLFVGGLAGRTLWRLVLTGNAIVAHEALFPGLHEIRDLRQGPDGFLYLLTRDSNEILRVER